MNIINNSLLASIIMFLSACAGGSGDHAQKHTHKEAVEVQVQAAPAKARINNDVLDAVFRQYNLLTEALTVEDLAEATNAANGIEAGAQHLAGGSGIASAAAMITSATSIDAQRSAYAKLSQEMEAMIKKAGLEKGELYIAHCPMALNDKGGSWIAMTKEIRNPYFGDEMLTCGGVEDTIK